MAADIVCAVLTLALASAYFWASAGIQDSFLSDEVGADGLPRVLAACLGFLGAALLVRAWVRRPRRGEPMPWTAHRDALVMLACGAGYILLMPLLGYALAILALIAFVAWYGGIALGPRLLVVSAAGSLVLWISFAKLFGIAMPRGLLFG